MTAVCFFGQLAVTQACLPLIRVARGRIVTISSIAGRLAMPFNAVGPGARPMLTLARLLPDRLMDRIILHFFGLAHTAEAR